jgi:hypothetical protein
MMARLILRPEVRREAEAAGLDAAYKANDGTEIGYQAEKLVLAALQAALSVIEERQG